MDSNPERRIECTDWGYQGVAQAKCERYFQTGHACLFTIHDLSESESYVTTDGQPASLSWNKAPFWGLRPDLYYCLTVAGLLIWGALSDEMTGPVGLATIFYCLRFETSLFVASYDSQGLGGGIRPPPPHGCRHLLSNPTLYNLSSRSVVVKDMRSIIEVITLSQSLGSK
jgi:hypothetical protein